VASTTTCGNGPCSFTATLKDGTVLGFGTQANGQIAPVAATTSAPPPSGALRTWLLNSVTDLNGNSLQITWTQAPSTTGGTQLTGTGQAYPARIDYTQNGSTSPMRSVQFYYSQRSDTTTSSRRELNTRTRRCSRPSRPASAPRPPPR